MVLRTGDVMVVIRTAQSDCQDIIRDRFSGLQEHQPAVEINRADLTVAHREARMNRKLDAQMVIVHSSCGKRIIFGLDSLIGHAVDQDDLHIVGEMVVEQFLDQGKAAVAAAKDK
ncbi:hypothetical protein D3C73_1273940 [compost metagenome]